MGNLRLHSPTNFRHDPGQVLRDPCIRQAEYRQAQASQHTIALLVIGPPVGVARTVQFNRELCPVTIEVYHEPTNYLLTPEMQPVQSIAAHPAPEYSLGHRHVPPEQLGSA